MMTENSYESQWVEEESDSESWGDMEDEDEGRGSESELISSSSSRVGQEQYVELMYQDKLRHLKRALEQLEVGVHPEYIKKLRKLEASYKERMRVNDIVRDLEIEMVQQDYVNEKKAAVREFEEHKVFLREQLVVELEDKQKMIESERHSMELTGDSMELKPISTRKLRRRTNEPSATGMGSNSSDKRRKNMQTNIQLLLDENEIIDDLRIVNKNKTYSKQHSNYASNSNNATTSNTSYIRETRIEDGKLFYEKKWFRRGQAVQVESFNGEKFPAMISSVGNEAICVRKTAENTKIRIYLSQLAKGKYLLKRRAV